MATILTSKLLDIGEEDCNAEEDNIFKAIYETRFEMGKEEYKIYIQQVNESQGFDVGTFEGFLICQIVPLDIERQNLQETLSYYSEEAIQVYNMNEKTNYKFHEVVKANVQADRGLLYYITFKARSPSEETCVIFQAKVLCVIMNRGIEVRCSSLGQFMNLDRTLTVYDISALVAARYIKQPIRFL
ncbi:UPF0725 protein [Senna tora]|uniref:UPF0725 protein n=1 Tax=Senna tora TaxID=362788 RepID=A0A834W357_9FABA|nr:UPF0725 protein [Senna tora]